MTRSTTILAVAGLTVVSGLLAYAVYFDYRRRTDVDFRKKLRKEKKKVDRSVAQSKESLPLGSGSVTPEALREALEQVKNEEPPKAAEEREQYFMSQVSMGEQLALQGPVFYLSSALSFYRALRVYPAPVELIGIYQKTVPEPIFKLVMDLTNLDVTDRVEGYYRRFPPKNMNVAVEDRSTVGPDGQRIVRKVVVATKDFAAGEIIYKEQPVVAVLDYDLQGQGTHCHQCLRVIEKGMAIRQNDALSSVYCSKDCQLKAQYQYHTLLFTLDSPLPPELPSPAPSPADIAARKTAQEAYIAYIKRTAKAAPLLVAKFIARQVAIETAKLLPAGHAGPPVEFPQAESGDYTLYDHVERLRYLEVVPPAGELPLLAAVLQNALPGLEQFVTDERHTTLLGKMAYNAYGVCFGGGRDDRPATDERPEDLERTRTPYGTARQIGSALFLVSSYLPHSCAPTARASFSGGTSELSLVAAGAVKKGDELSVSFVDVAEHAGEGVAECRRRRRMELARGWRFACMCTRCVAEAAPSGEESGDVPASQKDESKLEEAVSRYS